MHELSASKYIYMKLNLSHQIKVLVGTSTITVRFWRYYLEQEEKRVLVYFGRIDTLVKK